jgi:hypothetical protein
VRLPSISTRAASYGAVALGGFLIDLVIRFHEPPWAIIPLAASGLGFIPAAWVAVVFTQMLIIQPMLEDVVTHLPPGSSPSHEAWAFAAGRSRP